MELSRGESSSGSGNEDRISNLPDALIHQILSFVDMKFVVQTCVLSRRWRYIWTSVPVLHFASYLHDDEAYIGTDKDDNVTDGSETDDDDDETDDSETDGNRTDDKEAKKEDPMRFVNFVNKVLSLRENSNIHTFYLDSTYYDGEITVNNIYTWIAIAVSHNVQELAIQISIDEDFEIPACLCTSKSLTKLELYFAGIWVRKYKVILPSAMSLPRLKSLRLRYVRLSFSDEKLANKFFSSFPTLESLVMTNCEFDGMNLNMSFPELKYFKWVGSVRNGEIHENTGKLKLYAPSLTSFALEGYMPTSLSLENLSSLVNAGTSIYIKSEDREEGRILSEKKEWYTQLTLRFLRGFHKAKVLDLDNCFLEALGGSPDILDRQALEFYHLQRLRLWVCGLSRNSVRSIFYMLKISPNMESLSLTSVSEILLNSQADPFRDDEEFVEHSVCRSHHHLKFIEIKGFEGHDDELKFVEILLKHAMVLEKVVLRDYSLFSKKKGLKQKEKQMEKFCEMLRTFPRASTNVMISYSVSG